MPDVPEPCGDDEGPVAKQMEGEVSGRAEDRGVRRHTGERGLSE